LLHHRLLGWPVGGNPDVELGGFLLAACISDDESNPVWLIRLARTGGSFARNPVVVL